MTDKRKELLADAGMRAEVALRYVEDALKGEQIEGENSATSE